MKENVGSIPHTQICHTSTRRKKRHGIETENASIKNPRKRRSKKREREKKKQEERRTMGVFACVPSALPHRGRQE
jgi:hypothetical protein